MTEETHPKTRPANLLEFGGIVLLAYLASSVVLVPSLGIDLTDEGHYLQAIASEKNHSWTFPYGWHLKPIADLVDQNIALLRTLFSTILLILFYALWRSAAYLAFVNTEMESRTRIAITRVTPVIGVMVGLTYFEDLINRTPSYNWVNMAGICTAMTGTFLLSRARFSRPKQALTMTREFFLLSIVSFGSIFALPAKPSTYLVLATVHICFTGFLFGRKQAIRDMLLFGVTSLSMLAFALLFSIWKPDFIEVFYRRLTAPTLSPAHSVFGALNQEVTFIPRALLFGLEHAPLPTIFFAALAALGFFFTITASDSRFRKLYAACLGILLLLSSNPAVSLLPEGVYRQMDFSMSILGLGIVGLHLLELVRLALRNDLEALKSTRILISSSIVVASLAYGFGSDASIFGKLSTSLPILMLVPILFLSSRLALMRERRVGLLNGVLMVAIGLTGPNVIYDGYQAPYGMSRISDQIETVTFERGGQLAVDSRTLELYESYREVAARIGAADHPLVVSLVWGWNSGLPYLSGVPEFPALMPTLFETPGQLNVLYDNLDFALRSDDYNSVWIISDNLVDLAPDNRWVIEKAFFAVQSRFGADGSEMHSIFSNRHYSLWQLQSGE